MCSALDRRPSIRLANGHLSPAAFSPVPQQATGALLPPITLLPAAQLPFTVALLSEQQMTEGAHLAAGMLGHDSQQHMKRP